MTESKILNDVRREYETTSISRSDLDDNPFVEFGKWLQQARDLDLIDSTAMTLATANADGYPSARIVLLKGYNKQGFCWYTDSRSQKGQELAENPQASLLFHWRDLSRQIRVRGRVEPMPIEQAELYFHSRPEASRFSAASSCQTSPVENRAALETEVKRLRDLYPDGDVPRPEAWVGYRLKPDYFEFWQGLVNRLHDRITYHPDNPGWRKSRISP